MQFLWWQYGHVHHKYCAQEISSTCPCVVPLKHVVAMRRQENMPRECPIPRCNATPWVLNIKTHLARCHSTVAPNTVDISERVVVSQVVEKGRGRAKKIPMLTKPNITLKVAQMLDNEGAFFFESSLGRSDWEWKMKEDASSANFGSFAGEDSSASC